MDDARYTVVVADDEADQRDRMSLALERTGRFTVVGRAADGDEVIDLVREHQPDLMVIDLRHGTPGDLQGWPMIQVDAPDCAVVVLSGEPVDDHALPPVTAGTTSWFTRGIEPRRLVDEVLQLLAPSRDAFDVARITGMRFAAGANEAARAFVLAAVEGWGLAPLASTAALLACDAVGATLHASGEVEYTVRPIGADRVRVEIGTSVVSLGPGAAPEGRGRALLDLYAARWGTAVSGGEAVVWFEL
jgi:CheY-like chemotaxis protein